MKQPSMIACGLSLPHRAKMGLSGLKYGKKIKMKMLGNGAYKKDMPMPVMSASGMPGHMPTRTLKFRS